MIASTFAFAMGLLGAPVTAVTSPSLLNAATTSDHWAMRDTQTDTVSLARMSEDKKPSDSDQPDPQASPCKVVIMNLTMLGVPAEQHYVAQILTDTMAAEINTSANCEVVTQADVAQMMDFEATKQLTCADDTESCIAEIGGALGVERVISGSIGLLGSSYKVQIKLHNVAEGRVEGRYDKLIKGDAELLDQAAREAGKQLFSVPGNSASSQESAPVAEKDGVDATASTVSAPTTETTASPPSETRPDDSSGLSTILMGVGVVGLVGGLASVGGSAFILAGAAYATETTGDVNMVPVAAKVYAAPAAYISVVGIVAGASLFSIGGIVTATSVFLE